MKEQALTFGTSKALFGVLSLPETLQPGRPAILIPNTGIDHHVGPNRMHVELARSLARAGYAVLRFDIGGLGDSALAPGLKVDSVRDLRAAMDVLEARGCGARFVAFGLCSGANDAHQAALLDRRIVGCVFLDGYSYRTRKFWLHYYWERFTSTHRYRNALRRVRLAVMRRAADEVGAIQEQVDYFRQPSQSQMLADLKTFIARDMPLYFIYTGQVQYEYNYRDQLLDAFPVLRSYPHLTLSLMLHADHTFTRRAMREELASSMSTWMDRYFKPQRG